MTGCRMDDEIQFLMGQRFVLMSLHLTLLWHYILIPSQVLRAPTLWVKLLGVSMLRRLRKFQIVKPLPHTSSGCDNKDTEDTTFMFTMKTKAMSLS
jgi:hypothetical protein